MKSDVVLMCNRNSDASIFPAAVAAEGPGADFEHRRREEFLL